MPRRATHVLRWFPDKQRYIVTEGSSAVAQEIIPGSQGWLEWLNTIPSFSFESRWGTHCTLRKERLQRGGSYWYAYRSVQGRTKKRYLGKTSDLSLERLEEINQHWNFRESTGERDVSTESPLPRAESVGRTLHLMPILASKLRPPRLSTSLVDRSRLLNLLDAGQDQKLTLLQAPAGFGKTTLVNQWIAHCQHSEYGRGEGWSSPAVHPLGVAWISLDSGDNDPMRFWSSLITACQVFHEQIGQTAFSYLSQNPQLPFAPSPLETALTFLLNDLSRFVQRGLLIIEDYHLIEYPRIHETLTFFIEHLPASLHVVMLTRSEPPLPLVRWRARGDLLEVQGSQLRFSTEETAAFLQQIIHQELSEEAVRSLHTHLEGWAAGLRLLALSLQGQTTSQAVESYLTQLDGTSATARPHRPIQEYFMSEVFSTLPEPLQLFLLQTSILSRLTGSLCDAVTGRQDSAEWLELVERSGFFLEALDSMGEWYRYHALFAETMKAEATRRLGEKELQHLSSLASHWYEEHGMPMQAIEAALHAHEPECAARLIEGFDVATCFSERHTTLRWLEQLPEPLLCAHPALCFCYALVLYASEEVDISQLKMKQIEDLLQMAEEGWRRQEDLSRIGILYAFRTTLHLILNDNVQAAATARTALRFSPLTAEQTGHSMQDQPAVLIDWRCGCLLALGQEALSEGNFEKAYPLFLDAYALSLNNIDRVFTRTLWRLLGDTCIGLGELHQAAEYYQRVFTEPPNQDERGEDVIHTTSICGLARLSYEWNQLERTEQLTREVADYQFSGYLQHWEEENRVNGALFHLLVLHARGETAAVQQQLSALFARLQASPIPTIRHLIPDILTWQTRLQISDGDLSAARRTFSTLTSYEEAMTPLQMQTVQLLRARLFLAQGEAEAALHLLERLLITSLVGKHIMRSLEIQLLIALAYAADKQGQRARQRLSEVLAQARKEGFMRLFLDEGEPLAALLRSLLPSLTDKPLRAYAETILQAFTDPYSTGKNSIESPLLEPLSTQEQRVLTLLAAGRSNPEIAQELVVSVNTVKGHVKNLYRKLNVTNRVQAGEVARRFKLL